MQCCTKPKRLVPEFFEHAARAIGDGVANGGRLAAGEDERVDIFEVGSLSDLHSLDERWICYNVDPKRGFATAS